MEIEYTGYYEDEDEYYRTSTFISILLSVGLFYLGLEAYKNFNLNKSANRVILEYCDFDKNKKISDNEREFFTKELYPHILRINSAEIVDSREVYIKDGRKVPKRELTDWLNEYKPSEKFDN